MTWRIVVRFECMQRGNATFVHRVRNFGEGLWRACKADGWCSIPLDEVDRAVDELTVTVRSSRRVRRTRRMVKTLLDEHFLSDCARVAEINDGAA